MKICSPIRAASFLLATLTASPAWAVVTYTYIGNDFTSVAGPVTTSDHISITVSLATALQVNTANQQVAPTSFTISDGVQSVSNLE